jgi:hypothetical protein
MNNALSKPCHDAEGAQASWLKGLAKSLIAFFIRMPLHS